MFRQKDRAMQSFVVSPRLAVLLTFSLGASTPLAVLAQGSPSPSIGVNKPPTQSKAARSNGQKPNDRGLTIGTMHFNYRELVFLPGRDTVMRGPDIFMEMTDAKRGLHIVVMADNAVGRRLGEGKNTAQISGNVRYTLTQQIPATPQTPAGVRTIVGTAQRATYTEDKQNLRLLGGVHATLNDPSRFDGPAVLRCATLSLLGEGQYEITGDAGSTDIQFTPHVASATPNPRPDANAVKTKPKTPQPIGNVHITGFRIGHLHENEDARFEGPLVTVETANPLTKTQNTFKAPEITAALKAKQRRVDAKGGIQFNNRTVDATGHAQKLEGTAATAFWSEDEARLEADGNINATLTNTFTLKEPATLTAGHVTAEMGADARYTIAGPPEKTRLTFYPRPGKGKGKREKEKKADATAPQATPVSPAAPGAPDKDAAPALAANTAQADKLEPANKEQSKEQGADIQDPVADDAALNPQSTTHNPPFAFGSIVVTGFQTATYAPGDSIAVTGPKVRFTSTNVEAQNFANLSTPHLNADFDDENTISSLKASGGVTFRFEQPVKEHKERRWIAGDGDSAIFTNTEQSRTIQVKDVSTIDFYTPEYLEDKAHTDYTDKKGVINYNLTTNELRLLDPTRSGDTKFNPFFPPQPARTPDAKKKPKRK